MHLRGGVDRGKLGTPEIDVGLFPMMIMAVLARHVPRRRLVEMMLLGEKFDADEAARLGLVNRAVAPADLDAEVEKITDALASKSPITVRLGTARVRGPGRSRPRDRSSDAAGPPCRVPHDRRRTGRPDRLPREARTAMDGEMNAIARSDRCRTCVRWSPSSRPGAPRRGRWAGADKVARQHQRGKMTARERLAALFDDGLFFEIGMHGTQMGARGGPDGKDKPAADGVITTFGKIDGRMVCCAAYDFTIKGGSIGYTGEEKVTRLRSMALKGRWPMVWLIDSAGARIDPGSSHPDMISLFAGTGHLFREQVVMSGVVPQVAAMVGRVRRGRRTSRASRTMCRW